MPAQPSRRRFIGISAAASSLALLPFGSALAASAPGNNLVTWRGTAMGADASLQIHHPDPAIARALVTRVLAEIRRLEAIFTLYQEDSVLVRLNRTGFLDNPPPELVELLGLSRGFVAQTEGLFDPTVQPLWTLYAGHFAKPGADPQGPARESVAAALAHVGFDKLQVSEQRIALRRGMALTFNGIAQGYVTDRIVALLREAGIDNSLVDLGETRALGMHPMGRPWEVGIEDPTDAGRVATTLPLANKAVATSGPYGFRFEPSGRLNHIFDPQTGGCAARYRSVSVVAEDAASADALATACSLMSPDALAAFSARHPSLAFHVVRQDGTASRLGTA